MDDPNRTESAGRVCDDSVARARAALAEAGSALVEELFDPEEWPQDLRDRANRLVRLLDQDGSILETVQKFDERTIIQLLVDVRLLAADVELARSCGGVRKLGRDGGRRPTAPPANAVVARS